MSTTEGTLAEWLVEDGERVEAGQPIYCLETDKSVQEIEAPESGRLTQKVAAGETYPVGTEIGVISPE
jgi:pyruvate/2-oxoglutarate dehydrogenase complex dihydrolipoamide acyltransferase (E2) component